MAILIETESSQPRLALVDALKSKKQKTMFFSDTDFEILFQNYDPYNTKSAKLSDLVHGMTFIYHSSTTGVGCRVNT